jgi:hypothetical protein
MKSSREIPSVGTLIKIFSYDRSGFVKVASTENADSYGLVPDGSIALVVDEHTRFWGSETVPVVTAGDVKGWIFKDEWEVLNDSN